MTMVNDAMTGAIKGAAVGVSAGVIDSLEEASGYATQAVLETYDGMAETSREVAGNIGEAVRTTGSRTRILALIAMLGAGCVAFVMWRSHQGSSTKGADEDDSES